MSEETKVMATSPAPLPAYAEILQLATRVFEDGEYALSWVREPNMALEGQAPVDFLNRPNGLEIVKNVLLRIQYGVLA